MKYIIAASLILAYAVRTMVALTVVAATASGIVMLVALVILGGSEL